MIERIIQQKLIKTINNFPVTGIIGSRQVGKTTLAKQLIDRIEKKVVYIDLENPRDIVRLSDPNLFFEANQDKCIILDAPKTKYSNYPIMSIFQKIIFKLSITLSL